MSPSFQITIDKNLVVQSYSAGLTIKGDWSQTLNYYLAQFKIDRGIVDKFILPYLSSEHLTPTQIYFLNNPLVYSLTIEKLSTKESSLWSLTFSNNRPLVPLSNELWHKSIHDLKSPLTTMKIFADILKRKLSSLGSSDLVSHAQKILTKTDELTELINNFSEAYEIDQTKHRITSTLCSSKELLENAASTVQDRFPHLTITIREPPLIKVKFNPQRFNIILLSAIRAIEKYSPDCREIYIKSLTSDGYLDVSICPKDIYKVIMSDKKGQRHGKLDLKLKADLDIYCLLACQIVRLFDGDYNLYKTRKGMLCNITLPQAL